VDTRSKILTLAGVLAVSPRPLVIVTGYFDVLRAAHVREIQRARDSAGAAALLAMVLPRPGELLPQRARAELVAALRSVDYVVLGDAPPFGVPVVHFEEHDERLCRHLREHIQSRCRVQ
jgi:bifunctional ADP-heptose synthase (sugar kinase/adenylyltransferase)